MRVGLWAWDFGIWGFGSGLRVAPALLVRSVSFVHTKACRQGCSTGRGRLSIYDSDPFLSYKPRTMVSRWAEGTVIRFWGVGWPRQLLMNVATAVGHGC